jgi:hypothetical protein
MTALLEQPMQPRSPITESGGGVADGRRGGYAGPSDLPILGRCQSFLPVTNHHFDVD